MKRSLIQFTALLALLALAGAAPAASDDARTVRRLQEKAGADQLIKVDANRQEIALALADVAASAGQPQADLAGWSNKDYDALFALLQLYREELAALGLKQVAVDAAMESLRKRIEDLEQRMEYLPPDGMKIHGHFDVIGDDFLITGPGQYKGDAQRFRHFKQYVEMEFTAVHGPFLGITQVDFINYVGAYSAPQPLGVRRVYAELRTPIAMQTGDFNLHYTPLTFWRNEDEDPFAPEPFKGRFERLRGDLLLKDDHGQYLRGLRLLTELMFGDFALELETYGSILGGPGATMYTTAYYRDDTLAGKLAGESLDDLQIYFMTYLGGWRVGAEPFGGMHLSYQGVKMWDDQDTANPAYSSTAVLAPYSYLVGQRMKGFDSQVHSASANFNFMEGMLTGEAEYAISRYANPNIAYFAEGGTWTAGTPNYFANQEFRGGGYLPGSAMHASLSLGPSWVKLKGEFHQADESFVAPTAQNRTVDRNRSPMGPFYTENTLFNPQNGTYGGFLAASYVKDYPETQLTRHIIPPFTQNATSTMPNFNYLMPYEVGYEASSPYGLATPNRSGYGAGLDFDFWKGGWKPSLKVTMSQQIEGQGSMYDLSDTAIAGTVRPPEKYMMARAGMILDLRPLMKWPFRFIAGYRIESIDGAGAWAPEKPPSPTYPNGLPAAMVNFDSTRLDAGMEYYPEPKTMLYGGFRHLDYNGTLYDPESTYQPRGQFGLFEEYEIMGFGVRHLMGNDRVLIEVLYSNQTFPDRDTALRQGVIVAYQIEQYLAKFSVSF